PLRLLAGRPVTGHGERRGGRSGPRLGGDYGPAGPPAPGALHRDHLPGLRPRRPVVRLRRRGLDGDDLGPDQPDQGRPTAAGPPRPRELDAGWRELADGDAGKAADAVWSLAVAHRDAVPWLKERLLRPDPAPDPARLAVFLRDLDSDRFEVRETAA